MVDLRGGVSWNAINVVGWDDTGLIRDPRFRALDLDRGYSDYFAVLTVPEALELNVSAMQSQFPHIAADASRLDGILRAELPAAVVLVWVREWESGLG